jgi:pilus assembly protein CpaB
MRRGGRILVVLGLLLGLVTAAGTFVFLIDNSNRGTVQTVPTRQVVVALQNIPQRAEITSEMVGTAPWSAEAIPAGGVFENPSEVVGKIAFYPIYPGQLILPQMVVAKSPPIITPTGSIASFVIPEGKVAMAFSVSDLSSVAGAIQAGDTVDLLLTLQASALPNPTPRPGTATTNTGTEGLPVTQLMLQDVLVLHVGSWAAPTSGQNAPPPGGTLTFALDRQDALALKSAREQGEIDLVLRRVNDRTRFDNLEPVTLQYLNKRFKFNLVPGTSGR